jgi:hypothetical protein
MNCNWRAVPTPVTPVLSGVTILPKVGNAARSVACLAKAFAQALRRGSFLFYKQYPHPSSTIVELPMRQYQDEMMRLPWIAEC